MVHDFDVAIVGCGPVGATLAIALGQQGASVVVVERETSIHHHPRAVSFDGEVQRMYQTLGLAEKIEAVSTTMYSGRMENEAGQVLAEWRQDPDAGWTQGWCDQILFHQPDVEQILRDEIARLEGVELWDGHEVEGIEQDDAGVQLTIRSLESGDARGVSAAYGVGCDGGGSFVRRAIGAHFDTLGPAQDWVVIDGVKLRELDAPDYLVGYCWPSRPHLWIPIVEPRVRWEFMVLPEDDPEVVGTIDGAYELIERYAGREDVRLERAAIYTFLSLLADRWRDRRIFLAGDAAHMQPPLRAQGLCSGIRDAMNLAWKLAAVLHGEAADSLLDTYEVERLAHVRTWIEIATEQSNVINTTDPGIAAQRDAFMLANRADYVAETPPLGPGLHGDAQAPTGTISQQGVAADGTRLDELTGLRFLVAMAPEIEAALSDEARRLLAQERWFHVLEPGSEVAADLLVRHQVDGAIVVRPDRYILGVAQEAPELEEVLARWSAHTIK